MPGFDETVAKMYEEEVFFSEIQVKETPQSLAEKFKNAGFASGGKYLHKRRFSVSKDYINYNLITVKEVNIVEHFEAFLESCDKPTLKQRMFHKNNVYYIVYFSSVVPDEALEHSGHNTRPFQRSYCIKKQYDMILKSQNPDKWLEKFTFSEETICESGKANVRYAYSDIVNVKEDSEYFYLFYNEDMVLRIYKQGFVLGNAEDFRNFCQDFLENSKAEK